MVVCPSCGSSRIRNDYKSAPLVLRVIGIRALLCDYCNRQFRAFSPAPPRTRASRDNGRKPDVSHPASPPLNHNHIEPSREQARLELGALRLLLSLESNQKQQIQTQEIEVDLTGFASINGSQHLNGNGYVVPIQPELRSEIVKLHDAQSAKESQALTVVKERQKSNAACPECGSNWVRRRQRSGLERVVFALTNHKAFICRSCDASFYARVGSDGGGSNIMGSSRSAQT
jgi:transposase-like protein